MSSRLFKGGNMRRKRHEPLPPAALDEPFGPPPEEYLYRCPACGEEMLVNEAIMDWRSERPNFVENIPAACPRWGVPDATVRLWRTLTKSPSPPAGRYLERIDTMLVRWFPQRAAVGKLLFHTLSIDHHGGESP